MYDRKISPGVTLDYGADVLEWAAAFTSPLHDAGQVARNARPLLDWLEEVPNGGDRATRWHAMHRHYRNMLAAQAEARRAGRVDPAPVNQPGRFLAGAKELYAVLA